MTKSERETRIINELESMSEEEIDPFFSSLAADTLSQRDKEAGTEGEDGSGFVCTRCGARFRLCPPFYSTACRFWVLGWRY